VPDFRRFVCLDSDRHRTFDQGESGFEACADARIPFRQIRARGTKARVFAQDAAQESPARVACWRVILKQGQPTLAAPGFSWKVAPHRGLARSGCGADWRPSQIGNLVESKQLGGQGPGLPIGVDLHSRSWLRARKCWWGDGKASGSEFKGLACEPESPECVASMHRHRWADRFLLKLQEIPAPSPLPTARITGRSLFVHRATVAVGGRRAAGG